MLQQSAPPGTVDHVPAPFARDLCGYRIDTGLPNTSDRSDVGSRVLGAALFQEMGVPDGKAAVADPGAMLETSIIDHLAPLRPDLQIRRSRSITDFEQYRHLGVFKTYRKSYRPVSEQLVSVREALESMPPSTARSTAIKTLSKAEDSALAQEALSGDLLEQMPEESFLNVDITVGRTGPTRPSMQVGLSSKWSLRTDRAQDCVSQGSKLAALRRGAMPHFGVITIEPRPAMLKILADGSGAIDYVYHLDLPALTRAIESVRRTRKGKWSPGITFDRLMNQGRIRDYDDLVRTIGELPGPM